MKYLISIIAAIAIFCALIILLLNNGVEPSLTLSCILALFSWVIGYVVFLKFVSIERKLDEEDKKKYDEDDAQVGARTHKKHFRNNNQ
jgi:Mn2+/Fe2+ NRAMP family transporter